MIGSILDCVHECFNVDINNCQLFVYENNFCYLGRMDLTNGTVAETYLSSTMYYKKGNSLRFNKGLKIC